MNKSIARRLFTLLCILSTSTILLAYDGSVDRLLEGTIICSNNSSNPALAFDNNTSTFYNASGSKMQWVGLDLGDTCVITRVSYTPAPGTQYADKMLLTLFEGANSPDFMDAVPLYFIGSTPKNAKETTVDINVSRGFRYIRYVGMRELGTNSSPGNSNCCVAELKFYGHVGEGDDSQFYQITNLPTLSIHVQDDILPTETDKNNKVEYESQSLLIYENGTMIQDYPILFRVRGNFSATASENKAFRMKYNDGKSHHVMKGSHNESPAKAKKWVLINSYRDKTLMRNPVAWVMSKRAERSWTPWSQVVDLVVNGDYRGTYTLADAVTTDANRIDITEMTENDIDEETITGGYFVELDNYYSSEPNHFLSSKGNKLSIHDPDEDIIQPEQVQYIQNTWNNMESVVYSSFYSDKEKGLRSVLDLESFLKWFLVSEFNGNTDMICQVFKYKERGDDHFYTGPIWDADLALENDNTTYPANERMDWTYKVRCSTGNWNLFLNRVLSEPSVFAELQELWAGLRNKGAFNPDDLAADVDSLRDEVRASANLNFIRWPYLNQWVSLNPDVPGSWEAEVDRVREYVRDRVAWMDEMLSYGRLHQENGVYQIFSALDLCTFSQMVNEGGETDAEAVLLSDIDMTDYSEEFHPIGTMTNFFNGAFDGRGHVISNLRISGTDAVGLFGNVGDCTLSNIVFDESCTVEGVNKVGMLVGYARGGTVTISGIENHGSVIASGDFSGSLVGNGGISAIIDIYNSCNIGTITANTNAAALVGSSYGKVIVENSYNIGTITGATEGKDFAFASKNLSINNCWDYTSTQTCTMTPEQVDNGYLCYQLNNYDDDFAWRQNLDNGRTHDLYPVLSKASGRVYEKDGRYSNTKSKAVPYRYYNLVITNLQGGSSGTIQFSEFDILNESQNAVSGLSVYDGPDGYGGEGYGNLTDNSVSTKYCGPFSGYSYFLFDAGREVDAYGYRIYTANDTKSHSDRNPSSWVLYGSNTKLDDPYDSDWVFIDERDDDWTLEATNNTPYDFFIPHPIESLMMDKHSATLVPGDELQLRVISPATIQNQDFQWTSSNNSVATVDEQGHVVAVGVGTAEIILSAANYTTLRDTCAITVMKTLPGHRYYQLAIDAISEGDIIQFSEFDLLDMDGNEITPLTFLSATGDYIKDHDAGDLFDDNFTTKYCAAFNDGITLYIYIDAGARVVLSGYRFTTAADTQKFPGRNPVSWSLLGSNTQSEIPDDDVWMLLDRRENDNTLQAANYTPYNFFFTYPKPVTIMAKSYTREYGEPNPTFEYTTEGGTLDGDPEIACYATAASPVGEYPIVIKKGSVTNEVDSCVNGTLTITPAPLTVKADDATMEECSEMPVLTLTYEGWKNGEDESVLTVKPQATTTVTTQSPVGEYPIIVSGGQAVNYNFIYVNGVFMVTVSDGIDALSSAESNDIIFNLQGLRVNRKYKGVIIKKGKKISVK